MAQVPYPLVSDGLSDLKRQIWELIRNLYEDRIGGLNIGDVFVDSGDVLTLNLTTSGGLEKVSDALTAKVSPTGGLQLSSSGLAAKVKADYGITVDADGFQLKQQTTLSAAADISVISAADGTDHIDRATFNTNLGTLVTEINAIKTVLNSVIIKLKAAEVIAA